MSNPLRYLVLVAAMVLMAPRADARQDDKGNEQVPDSARKLGATPAAECRDGFASGYSCQNVHLVSFVPLGDLGASGGNAVNDVWGWIDDETGQRYALVGREDGIAFLDITVPEFPVYVGELPKTPSAQTNVWRDVKVDGHYAFVVADGGGNRGGAHGMQVFDLKRLSTYSGVPITFSVDALYSVFSLAHNIVINQETDRAYVVGARGAGQSCGGGLHIIDIADPLQPRFLGCAADAGTGRAGTGYTHDAQCVVYHGPDSFYIGREICIGSNETAISISDVTNAVDVVQISRGTYPNSAYIHQGWLTDDHRYFIQNDELDELGFGGPTTTMIWDMVDLNDPVLLTRFLSDKGSIDHNLYLRDGLAYQANYTSGLRILDVRDPSNPAIVGWFDTTPDNERVAFAGAWTAFPYPDSDLVVVTSRKEGLFVLRTSSILGTRFSSFTATALDGVASLEWTLSREQAIVEYVIEARRQTGTFEAIDRVVARGDVGTDRTYFYDYPIEEGVFFLRILAKGADEGVVASQEISMISMSGSHLLDNPYPNPSSGRAFSSLTVAENQYVIVALFDINGREIVKLYDDFLAAGNQIPLSVNTENLSGGVYFLHVIGQTFSTTKQIVVSR